MVAATVNVVINNAGIFTLVDVVLSQTVDKKLVQKSRYSLALAKILHAYNANFAEHSIRSAKQVLVLGDHYFYY